MGPIETITRYGSGRNTWLNVSGGVGNESLASLTVASISPSAQCIAVRLVTEDGKPVPLLNPRTLLAYKTTRFRLPGIFLRPGQRIECFCSEHADWTMTLTRVNGGRPRTNRIMERGNVGGQSTISPTGSPFEIESVVCVNKTEAEARASMSFRNAGGSVGTIFIDEIVPGQKSYRAAIPNFLIAANQSLEVFSTADCAWIISGVTA